MLYSANQITRDKEKGPDGYITHAAALERGTNSAMAHKWAGRLHNPPSTSPKLIVGTKPEVANKWAGWLHNPYPLGGLSCFTAGDKIRKCQQLGSLATQPMPPWGSATLHSGGRNQPKSEVDHMWVGELHNPCCLGVPRALERGTKSEVAHKWADAKVTPAT